MSEIQIGNTPIFEQLKQEFEARGKRYESLIADGARDLRPASLQGYRAPFLIVDEMDDEDDEYINVMPLTAKDVAKHPLTVLEQEPGLLEVPKVKLGQYENLFPKAGDLMRIEAANQAVDDYVQNTMGEFRRNHPLAVVEGVEFEPQEDGSMNVVITAKEPVGPRETIWSADIDPMNLVDQDNGLARMIAAEVENLERTHTSWTGMEVHRKDNWDGTVTIWITAYPPVIEDPSKQTGEDANAADNSETTGEHANEE